MKEIKLYKVYISSNDLVGTLLKILISGLNSISYLVEFTDLFSLQLSCCVTCMSSRMELLKDDKDKTTTHHSSLTVYYRTFHIPQ